MKFNCELLLISVALAFTLTSVSPDSMASERLLYPQEKVLTSIRNKVDKIIKVYRTYNNLNSKKQYTLKPKPGLGIAKDLDAVAIKLKNSGLPMDNEKVKKVNSYIVFLQQNLPLLEKYYLKGYKTAQIEGNKSNKSNFKDYDKDVAHLKEVYKHYKNPESTFFNAHNALKVIPQFNDEYAFYKNLPKKYALMLKAKKADKLKKALAWSKDYMEAFHIYQEKYAKKLPGLVESKIADAVAIAEKAQAENKPAFFKGGVKQQEQQALDLLSIYEAIKGKDNAEVIRLGNKFDAEEKRIEAIADTMASQLLASVKTPKDVYNKSDKSKLKRMVEAEWKKLYPSDKVLSIRFYSDNWNRTIELKWNNSGWYKVDNSVLPVSVLVKTSDKIVTIYAAFLNKNHLKNNATNVGAHTKKHGYVIRKMLVKNLDL